MEGQVGGEGRAGKGRVTRMAQGFVGGTVR